MSAITKRENALRECFEIAQRASLDDMERDSMQDLMAICTSLNPLVVVHAYKAECRRQFCDYLMRERGFK